MIVVGFRRCNHVLMHPLHDAMFMIQFFPTEITEDSLLKILGDCMNSEVDVKKSSARNEIYSYRQILSVLQPEDNARSRKSEFADIDDGSNT